MFLFLKHYILLFITNKMTLNKYISVTKLVEELKANVEYDAKDKPTHALIYFEGKNSCIDKFNKISVKPIYIQIKSGDKTIKTLDYKEITQMFNKFLILSFSQNYRRQVPDKNHLYNLIIQFTPLTFITHEQKQITYYNTELYRCTMQNVIDKVRNQFN